MSEQDGRAGPLLSLVQKFIGFDASSSSQPHDLHPFAAESARPPTQHLKDLEIAATTLQNSLTAYINFPVTDAKLVSTLRQNSAIAFDLHATEQDTRQRVNTLRKRLKVPYGEDVPIDRSLVAEWCVSRLERWGNAAGMEIFKDEEKDNRLTLVMGGKVLVIDIDCVFDRTSATYSRIEIANVKTSYALPSGTSGHASSERSASLDWFLKCNLGYFLDEVQQGDLLKDTAKAAQIGHDIERYLDYLMKLDNLASREGDKGICWFHSIDELAQVTERIAKLEVRPFARDLAASVAPLDIVLLRGHALPMPYLSTPSIDFLIYLSPLSYLTLLRWSKEDENRMKVVQTWLDIPLSDTRTRLARRDNRPPGTILATLSFLPFVHGSHTLPKHGTMPSDMTTGSTFPNVLSELNDSFGHLSSSTVPNTSTQLSESSNDRPSRSHVPPELVSRLEQPFPLPGGTTDDTWVLDFTDGGHSMGVVVSQSRMREIQTLINPANTFIQSELPLMSYSYGSWVDLLLNPLSSPSDRYVAVYRSPSHLHPPLHLRLTTTTEPGFLLGRVPVRNLKEVWGVLEIVREQCWLNETLRLIKWVPEGQYVHDDISTDVPGHEFKKEEPTALEEQLSAILNGTYEVQRIPVNLFIPIEETMYDASDPMGSLTLPRMFPGPPRFIMTFPTREAHPSQMNITVSHDVTRPRGIRIDVTGSLPLGTEQVEKLEEFARKGGILGLAGQLWNLHPS